MSFKLARRTSGRKIRGKYTTTRSGVAGSNSFRFTGKLAAGTYELTATPAGGTSETVTFNVAG